VSNPPGRLRPALGTAGRQDRSSALAAGIPAVFTGTVFDPADERMAGAFSARSESVLRTGSLPVPMQREISWWLATCQDNGERVVNANDWRRWTATAAEVATSSPEVRSFADLSLAGWMAEWSRKFHADHGRLPAPGTRAKAETALRGLLPRLAIHYSGAPWWKHDLWCLRFDPRIPRRAHEPHGDAMIRWDDIEPAWLREGAKFYTGLQVESGQITWSTVFQTHVFAARLAGFALARGLSRPALSCRMYWHCWNGRQQTWIRPLSPAC